jgi:hypothetical protein
MIPLPIRLLAVAFSLAYLCAIVVSLRRSRMTTRQSVLWLATGFAFLGVSIFPQPLLWAAERFGFVAPSNAAFIVWMLFLTLLLFYQSLTTSRQSNQIKTLAQEIAVLKAERPERKMEPEQAD